MPFSPLTRVGPYIILAPLGAGGMGEVYRAEDTRLGRHVAIKAIPRPLAKDRRRLRRFELEARATSALNHPNIVSIFDVGQHKGLPFVVMELVEGRTLRSVLKEDGALPVPRALAYAAQVAEGLGAAHAKGIVHRDLTPGNVMVAEGGRVKVVDFGLAKLLRPEPSARRDRSAAAEETSISEEGSVAGTVPYMAPEQIRGDEVDPRTDLFALGILLYEMVTGRRPFEGETAADVASAILRDRPAPARTLRLEVPEALDRLLARALEKEPQRRHGSATELLAELAEIARRLEPETSVTRSVPGQALAARSAPAAAAAPSAPSIAVLPFANRSLAEEDEYFSDGLADELQSVLAKIPGLRVVGRTSSYQFKGTTEDLRVIGRKLGVATLLEGSVRKTERRVRISVQLVQVSDGFQLWSGTYDRTLDDILAVQDDIAQSVLKELRATLLGDVEDSRAGAAAIADVAAAARGRGAGGEAYRLYLQGRYFVNRNTREDLHRGIGYLIEALQADPELALAWAELAGAYAIEAGYGWHPVEAGHERARKAAERALALEPGLPEGHVRLGSIQMNYDRDWARAEASFRRALDAAPGNGIVLRLAGNLASNLGRLDEAIALYRRALDRDPLSPAAYQSLAITYHAAGHLREAEEAYRMSLELAPQRVGTRSGLGLVLLAQGRVPEACAIAEEEPEPVFRLLSTSIAHHAAGRRAESDERLRELIGSYAEGGAYQIAEVHAARGEADAAFEWLERAYEQRDGGLVEMKPEPAFRALHADPRWKAFLARMGLEG
ncbi:MAG TPA: protein kinase [Candidatus Eisenbacteria bacterium]|nr:protein kinase [Candidatus Eisenbacteria bacterium]